MGRRIARRMITRLRADTRTRRLDDLVVEEPLEIRLNGAPLSITMRTPGHDFELAAGFLVSEGVVGAAGDLAGIAYCPGARTEGGNTYNVLDVTLAAHVPVSEFSLARNVYTTSSCGVCGKASLDAVRTVARWSIREDPIRLDPSVLRALPDRLRESQLLFERTGGLHAAALCTVDGELLAVREDVGRHNAVDKLLGWALLQDRLPLRETILLVSGRASFELAQKAVMGGIPALVAVSAPSSLAVELAEETGLTVIGFLRGTSMNVYTGAERLLEPVG
ncbi:formate dehydrogenase accessory sulfurtransferase FdhD [Crossiella sp. CA-258035]|uniref:formate dehydrogenase accessory sulfurtransferase FdhD n=1 Tax=Crossiella sp. CA-258035 TaxID=2981138 RepID=UPI0024BD4647|nr:formate dehydrogenase accessory sulfurtransferase FdhD [Crossiella sp. CA-258035]WHT22262.1 formate dehydrogenase accessory sulfurtransferase FdhD [Crossiella sp. CA-258035]